MQISRRDFLKLTGLGLGAVALATEGGSWLLDTGLKKLVDIAFNLAERGVLQDVYCETEIPKLVDEAKEKAKSVGVDLESNSELESVESIIREGISGYKGKVTYEPDSEWRSDATLFKPLVPLLDKTIGQPVKRRDILSVEVIENLKRRFGEAVPLVLNPDVLRELDNIVRGG